MDHGTKSVLTVKNNHLECCPIHDSVAFHPFHLNWILQSKTARKIREEKEDDRQKEKQTEWKGERGLREIRAYPKTDIQLNVNCKTFPLCVAK